MAKINKNLKKSSTKNSKSFKLKKKTVNLKECFVKLDKIDHLIQQHTQKKNETSPKPVEYTYNLTFKIGNGKLEAVGSNISGNIFEKFSHVYDVNLKIRNDDIVFAHKEPDRMTLRQLVKDECKLISKPAVRLQSKTLLQIIDDAWKKCLKDNAGTDLKENVPVMARMKGYKAWPGEILVFTQNRKSTTVSFETYFLT